MNRYEYIVPDQIKEVFDYLDGTGTVIKAGGIDFLDLMKENLASPQRLVNIRHLKELKFLKKAGDGSISIGPTVTLSDLANDSNLPRSLRQAADGAATPQIRNVATLGGNLCQRPRCWYFRNSEFKCARHGGDTCYALDGENQYHAILGNQDGCAIVQPSATAVALTALDAQISIASANSSRMVNIDKFYISPGQDITRETVMENGELVTEILIPAGMKDYQTYYFKLKEKQSFDWPIADVAVSLRLEGKKCTDARIVLGSAAPVPWRSNEAEQYLRGKTVSKTTAREAGRMTMIAAQPLSQNGYKVEIFKTVVYRTICWASGIDPLS